MHPRPCQPPTSPRLSQPSSWRCMLPPVPALSGNQGPRPSPSPGPCPTPPRRTQASCAAGPRVLTPPRVSPRGSSTPGQAKGRQQGGSPFLRGQTWTLHTRLMQPCLMAPKRGQPRASCSTSARKRRRRAGPSVALTGRCRRFPCRPSGGGAVTLGIRPQRKRERRGIPLGVQREGGRQQPRIPRLPGLSLGRRQPPRTLPLALSPPPPHPPAMGRGKPPHSGLWPPLRQPLPPGAGLVGMPPPLPLGAHLGTPLQLLPVRLPWPPEPRWKRLSLPPRRRFSPLVGVRGKQPAWQGRRQGQ
jgi:hypothetical protein